MFSNTCDIEIYRVRVDDEENHIMLNQTTRKHLTALLPTICKIKPPNFIRIFRMSVKPNKSFSFFIKQKLSQQIYTQFLIKKNKFEL